MKNLPLFLKNLENSKAKGMRFNYFYENEKEW